MGLIAKITRMVKMISNHKQILIKFITLVFCINMFSCVKKDKEEIIFFLTNGNQKSWVLKDVNDPNDYGIIYKRNGYCIQYYTDEGKKIKKAFYLPNQWKLVNDSIIENNFRHQLIIKFINENKLILFSKSLNETFIYIKSENQDTNVYKRAIRQRIMPKPRFRRR